MNVILKVLGTLSRTAPTNARAVTLLIVAAAAVTTVHALSHWGEGETCFFFNFISHLCVFGINLISDIGKFLNQSMD